MDGIEGLDELADLGKQNWLLEEGVGSGPEAAMLTVASGAASAPCTS